MVESNQNHSEEVDSDEEEDEEKTTTQGQRDEMLMKAVKERNYEEVTEALKIGADP